MASFFGWGVDGKGREKCVFVCKLWKQGVETSQFLSLIC